MTIRPIQSPPSGIIANPRARTRPSDISMRPPEIASTAPPPKRTHHVVDRTGENWDADGNYIVGKRRPPKATQWKKGQSGNQRGPTKRPTLSAQEKFEQTFLAPFQATVNGESVPFTMDVFAVQALKNAAVKGSVRAAQILLDFYALLIRKVADQEPGPEVDAWEQEAIDRLLAELHLPERPIIRQIDRSKDPA